MRRFARRFHGRLSSSRVAIVIRRSFRARGSLDEGGATLPEASSTRADSGNGGKKSEQKKTAPLALVHPVSADFRPPIN